MTNTELGVGDVCLNDETKRWLRRASSVILDDSALSHSEARDVRHGLSDRLATEFSMSPDETVASRDHVVGLDRIVVREYRPVGAASDGPAYVYLHGGAFWHGSIDERVNASLVTQRVSAGGVVAFAIQYRLAPEFPYPAAIDDTVRVVEWLHGSASRLGIDATRIILGGVSAGANIATAAAHRLGARGLLAGLLLEVPAIDLRERGSWDVRFAAVNGLNSPKEMVQLYSQMLSADDADISPMLIEHLRDFPPTHIMTAEYDPLRDGGEILAQRLRAAGVPVSGARYFGALHASLGLTARDPIAIAWHDDVCSAIRRLSRLG